eukprot:365311-Chlamydomonas_euryale.AAC.6
MGGRGGGMNVAAQAERRRRRCGRVWGCELCVPRPLRRMLHWCESVRVWPHPRESVATLLRECGHICGRVWQHRLAHHSHHARRPHHTHHPHHSHLARRPHHPHHPHEHRHAQHAQRLQHEHRGISNRPPTPTNTSVPNVPSPDALAAGVPTPDALPPNATAPGAPTPDTRAPDALHTS